MTVSPDELRSVLRQWASGVTVVTSGLDGMLHGMTVNSFSSVSLEPPLASVNIERRTRTHALIHESGAFAVCILSIDQQSIAERFGGGIADDAERFDGIGFKLSEFGNPIPEGCLAVLECRTVAAHTAGTHTVFIGEVMALADTGQATPLIYFNRKYRGLANAD